ncbi:MAG: peptidylprolyl isomerase [Candidatus Buchananbacteria bacterium CG10_big_fil_rev_8_21_14_0_10_42_9]|uniref:Peptidyl-prolyl cis-trans isomerase n=1 Tax=Candidatus Buchananbacteria bacterium CG10_big_fil_rev_8_21_14_0_10_42_9 TaxID=1974526 RepID=A0A2H0W0H4_9BACT|nr:MAG: peptidylprolyl isomerase [Candidatus Buchananbacteria bacterium CG10_big_fil_rev_8_21_14_0_10_42_9]
MKKWYFILAVSTLVLVGCTASNQSAPSRDVSKVTPAESNAQSTVPQTPNVTLVTNEEIPRYMAKQAIIKTNTGDITVELYGADSPNTVANFVKLAEAGFYDGIKFHRVIPDFMIQGGDPNSRSDDRSTHGRGGPGYTFPDEINQHKIVQGSLAMANSGPNTNGSQFFIVTAEATPWLDGRHTNFGHVTKGMDVVLEIAQVPTDSNDNPLTPVAIESIEVSP